MMSLLRPNSQLRTARLFLRRPCKADLADAVGIYCDPRATPYSPAGPISTKDTERMLRGFICHWWRYGYGYWAIELLDSGEVVGFGGLSRGVERGEGTLNLYYGLRPSAWGHGYAVEMARCAVEWAARVMPETPVVIFTRPENLPAVRVAEKLGFVLCRSIEKNGIEYSEFRAL